MLTVVTLALGYISILTVDVAALAAASCVSTTTDEANVYVANRCAFPIVARVQDKHKIDRGLTGVIAPGKRELLKDFGISDGMSVKTWCDAGKRPHCRPP
jgi:hypothetical protein